MKKTIHSITLAMLASATMLVSATAQKKIDNVMTRAEDGTVIVNTTTLGSDVIGYAGIVPVELHIKDQKVVKVVALPNQETPRFFQRVLATKILNSWDGATVKSVKTKRVDAVTGATLSSEALIENVKLGAAYANKHAKQLK